MKATTYEHQKEKTAALYRVFEARALMYGSFEQKKGFKVCSVMYGGFEQK